jgi:peroxiredoxin
VTRLPPFPQAVDDGGGDHLTPGMRLPAIALPATDGGTIALAAIEGRCLVIVYPWTGRSGLPNPPDWDSIPGAHGSTPELEGFRDRFADFAALGLRLFGLSRQATVYQRELVMRLALPFPLLSDADGAFGAALCLPAFATGGTTYLKRLTLLIADGRIERVFYPVIDPAAHAAEVLRMLEKGQER